ncbi:MAG TPA: shikimate dehydrogenase [Gemmatimonadaceae bacterium]|nr:shikimate dehydrogenase [Gemmatimonadaceae bacterium]
MDLPGRLVLIGHPVAHSLSPAMQNAALRSAGIPLTYETFDVEAGRLARVAGLLTDANAAGNVTVPHKEAFSTLCKSLSPVADRVRAVNTFWTEDGTLFGDNTDVGGFNAAVRLHFGLPHDHGIVALLGAGGSAAAVLAAVERWDGARVRIFARTSRRASALAARFARIATVAPTIEDAVGGASLVVNATPVGLDGPEFPVDPAILSPGTDVLDLTYRRGETPWVHACRGRGLRAGDGLAMLVEQGALAFERWFGAIPDRDAMWKAARS